MVTEFSAYPESSSECPSARCSPSSPPAAWPSTRRSACSPSRSWILWFATSPPLVSTPSGTTQIPGHFILIIINLHNVCVYATHCLAKILSCPADILIFRSPGYGRELNIFFLQPMTSETKTFQAASFYVNSSQR